ncbi:MAG TPA: arginine--tRNA ligase, partial [Bacteroidales bacterium]|nr:arginine--tRNA ligase [Bacteroidales bacterium]
MMEHLLREGVRQAIIDLYGSHVADNLLQIQKTRKEFEGDYTLVVFPLLKTSGKSPEITGNEIGSYMAEHLPAVSGFNVVKGFLNLVISPVEWRTVLADIHKKEQYGFIKAQENSPLIVVEFSSPNTNKPLHLGHIRNNLLGYS